MLRKILNEMKRHFRGIKNRREDFLHFFKVNFDKHFDLTKIDLDAQENTNIILSGNNEEGQFKCGTCASGEIVPKTSKRGLLYLGCSGFPSCKVAYFFSPKIRQYQELEEHCEICQNRMVTGD